MAFGFLTNKEARERIASLSQAISAKGGTPKQYPDFHTSKEAKATIAELAAQLAGLTNHAASNGETVDPDGQFPADLQQRLQALDARLAKAKEATAKLNARTSALKAAATSLTAKRTTSDRFTSSGGSKVSPRSIGPRWDRDARVAEGKRLLALPRNSAEITNLIKEALDIHKGVSTRQRIVDVVTEQAMQAGLYARFYEVMKLTYSVGPKAATPYPPPPTHEHDMSAADLLALSTEAKASLADRALREEQGRLARIEIKRAFASASPAQQSAMRGAFGQVLDSHKHESI